METYGRIRSPQSTLKANLTRRARAGVKMPSANPTVGAGPKIAVPHDPTDSPQSNPLASGLKAKIYKGKMRFIGSMKFGGRIHKTGLYLMHSGEHVRSPYKRG